MKNFAFATNWKKKQVEVFFILSLFFQLNLILFPVTEVLFDFRF